MTETAKPKITFDSKEIVENEFKMNIEFLNGMIKMLQAEKKRLQTEAKKNILSAIKKDKTKPKRKNVNSHFKKPVPISEQMCDFLGHDHGTEVSRTDVTKAITAWIKEKHLQNPKDKREILLDHKNSGPLNKLIGDVDPEHLPLTFFKMQKYLTVHYTESAGSKGKAAAAVAPESSASEEEPETAPAPPAKKKRAPRKRKPSVEA